MDNEHIYKSYNKSLLPYYLVFPTKHRKCSPRAWKIRSEMFVLTQVNVTKSNSMNYRDASIRVIYYIPKSKTNCDV